MSIPKIALALATHLRKILIQAAHGAKMKRGTFYRAKYNKLVFRLGSANKAKVAIANRLARSIYLILGGDRYRELEYMRGDPHEQKIQRLVGQLRALREGAVLQATLLTGQGISQRSKFS